MLLYFMSLQVAVCDEATEQGSEDWEKASHGQSGRQHLGAWQEGCERRVIVFLRKSCKGSFLLEMEFSKRVKILFPPLVLLMAGTWAVAGFQVPNEKERVAAVGSLVGMKASMRRVYTVNEQFEVKREPEFSDWLANHEEEGQTFRQYLTGKPNRPGEHGRNTLYILPLGDFPEENSPNLKLLEQHMSLYYAPMRVRVLPVISEESVPAVTRENGLTGQLQWHTGEMLRWLRSRVPRDCYGLLAVTMTDLYPGEGWNFVFGQASYKNRVGIFSFARFQPKKNHEEVGLRDSDLLAFRRACKVLTHEMGHMFGIKHCIYYECNMNGANSLVEADASPMHLCPVCLRKLQDAIGFDAIFRYQELERFYQKQGLKKESVWVEKRLAWLLEK